MTQYVNDAFLAARYDMSRRSVWRWAQKGLLPKPIKITKSCTRWRLDEIETFERAAESAARRRRAGGLGKRRCDRCQRWHKPLSETTRYCGACSARLVSRITWRGLVR